jgi:hypothetical protein
MGYQPLRVNINAEGDPWVSIGCHKRPGGYGQLKFTVSETVAQFLSLDSGCMVWIERGVGDDAGTFRFRRCTTKEDGFIVSPSKNCKSGNLKWRTSSRFLSVEGRHKTVKCPDTEPLIIDDVRWVLCTLPEWAVKATYRIWHPDR